MAERLSTSRRKLVKLLQQHQTVVKKAAAAQTAKHHHIWQRLRWPALAAAVVGVLIGLFLTQYSVQPVSLAGIPVSSHQSQPALEQALQSKVNSYQLRITYPDKTTKAFNIAEAGITVDTSQSTQYAMNSKMPANFLRRAQWWHPLKLEPVLVVDKAKLDTFVQANALQTTSPAKDATIAIDKGNVVITPEQDGAAYSLGDGQAAVKAAVAQFNSEPLVLQVQVLKPTIVQGDLISVSDKVKTIMAQPVTFIINSQKITAKPTDIAGWIELTPVPSSKTVDITVNSGRVLTYMNAIARPYIQPPVTQVVMPSVGTVLIPGRNGVDIVNKETMAADVAKQIAANQSVTVELPVKFSAFKTITAQPHDKWIVVDVTTKRMYAYEQTRLVKSFLISAGAPATPTVTGEFKIYSKYASQDMRGANADGSRYFQPNVKYVNYFYADYAIHGNYWRPLSYFGNVNSSHGCVGIVDADAAWIYNWAPIGTTVIVHR